MVKFHLIKLKVNFKFRKSLKIDYLNKQRHLARICLEFSNDRDKNKNIINQ